MMPLSPVLALGDRDCLASRLGSNDTNAQSAAHASCRADLPCLSVTSASAVAQAGALACGSGRRAGSGIAGTRSMHMPGPDS